MIEEQRWICSQRDEWPGRFRADFKCAAEKNSGGDCQQRTDRAAGHLLLNEAKEHQVPLIPIDSEPSAIFQCLRDERRF